MAEALFGLLNPGGKLPISLPSQEGQLPVYYNALMPRANYVDWPAAPPYPFGHGLSYTTFDYGELRITPEAIALEESARVSVTVRNTGAMAGDEVVQLYVTDDIASVVRPGRELKGFARVHLEPGRAWEVTFTLDRDDLACVGLDMHCRVEPGTFTLGVGGSLEGARTGTLPRGVANALGAAELVPAARGRCYGNGADSDVHGEGAGRIEAAGGLGSRFRRSAEEFCQVVAAIGDGPTKRSPPVIIRAFPRRRPTARSRRATSVCPRMAARWSAVRP